MTAHIPTVGTIIHGTLATQDLLIAFADALERYGEDHPQNYELSREARKHASVLNDSTVDIEAINWGSELLNDLFDALDEIAAKYELTFSAHEGDGSDFGFWPIPESDENQP